MTCVECSKEFPAAELVNITWIGQVKWSGKFCKGCTDAFWSNYKGVVAMQLADVIFEQVKDESQVQ